MKMNIERISQNIPYLYWLLHRWKSFKKIEEKQEGDRVNPVGLVLYSPTEKGVKKDNHQNSYLGKEIDSRA